VKFRYSLDKTIVHEEKKYTQAYSAVTDCEKNNVWGDNRTKSLVSAVPE